MTVGDIMIMGPSPSVYYSPPFMRGGCEALFAVDVLKVQGANLTLDISIEHKNSADTSWSSLADFTQIVATGFSQKTTGVAKEVLRLKYLLAVGAAGSFVHVYTYPPSWKPGT